jgi:hypothetical protein
MDGVSTLGTTAEALRWVDEIEKAQGGANGLTIKLRAAIVALGEPVSAEICERASEAGTFADEHRDAWSDGRAP